MRCYLLKDGKIRWIRVLPESFCDQEAIESCRLAYERHREAFDDFGIWRDARKIYQHSLICNTGSGKKGSPVGPVRS
jgi:hypothetical protein